MLWYPVKDIETAASNAANLLRRGVKRILRLELQIDTLTPQGPLARSGLVIVNPPFRLDLEAKILQPWLAGSLGGEQPGFMIDWPSEV